MTHDMQSLPVRQVSIINKKHPEWGTFGVYADNGDHYEIFNRGHRVLFKSEAEKDWEVA